MITVYCSHRCLGLYLLCILKSNIYGYIVYFHPHILKCKNLFILDYIVSNLRPHKIMTQAKCRFITENDVQFCHVVLKLQSNCTNAEFAWI